MANKFNKGQRVYWVINSKKHFGTVLNAYQAFNDTIEYDILDDSLIGEQEITTVFEKDLKSTRKPKMKWVLKTHILDDIHPKDLNKYVKIKVIK